MAELSVGFGAELLAPKRRFMVCKADGSWKVCEVVREENVAGDGLLSPDCGVQ